MWKSLILAYTALSILGCGKYLPPIAPEDLAPAAVKNLESTATIGSVDFKWEASESDQQGKELRSMDGYIVYRKLLEKPADLVNESVPFEAVATVSDKHVNELLRLREQALAEGKPTRKVKIDENLTKFTYADKSVEAGKTYAYRIVPVNQNGVEGAFNKIVKVLYRGDSSEVVIIDQAAVVEDDI